MDMKRKQYPVTVEEISPRKMGFIISTAAIDRDGDTIDPKGWDLTHYKRNPVVLWAHDYTQLPVGKALNIEATKDGLKADVEFPPPGTYPFADTVHDMLKAGFLNATSVGFAPVEHAQAKTRERGYDFSKQELLEFSIVPVPSNPEALAQRGLTPEAVKEYRKALSGWLSETEPHAVKAVRKAGYGSLLTDENEAKLDAFTKDYEKESDGGKKEIAKDLLETMLKIHELLADEKEESCKDESVQAAKAIAIEVARILQKKPKPNSGEKQEEFFARCMASEEMNSEFPDEEQRSAMCTVAWTGENDPAEGELPKGLSKNVIDIKDVEAEIVWDSIDIPVRKTEFDAKLVSEMLLDSVKSTIREMAGASARAAINRMTGRLD